MLNEIGSSQTQVKLPRTQVNLYPGSGSINKFIINDNGGPTLPFFLNFLHTFFLFSLHILSPTLCVQTCPQHLFL